MENGTVEHDGKMQVYLADLQLTGILKFGVIVVRHIYKDSSHRLHILLLSLPPNVLENFLRDYN